MRTHGVLAWRMGLSERDAPAFAIRAHPHVIVRVKRLLPRANPYRGGWVVVSDTPEVARDLQWIAERYPLEMDEQTAARLAGRADEHRATEALVERILAGDHRDGAAHAAPAREPRPYQSVAADLAAATGRLLLLDAVGLGKSMSGLLVLRDEELLPAVVVCYPHLERQWAAEVAATFPWMRVHAVTKMAPYDPATRRSTGYSRPDVMIVPWSKLRGWGHHLAGQARTVIFDEAQELRTGPGSQKHRAAAEVAEAAACRIELTATPVYNYGGEIFSLVSVIAPDVLGQRDEFMREWCGGDDGPSRRATVSDPAGLGLYLREQGVMLRRTRRDVGRELPATERIPHVVAHDDRVLDGDATVVSIADAVLSRAIGGRELFLAAGELDWRMRRLTGLAKAPYVAEFVSEIVEADGDRVVLYGWHRDVYEQWRLRLAPHRPAFYTGTESKREKQRSFDAFVDGDSRVLIVSLRAGAGLDGLQGASRTAVFGELDWSPGVHEQCLDAETEVLTRRGFVGPDEIRPSDDVAALDTSSDAIRWQRVARVVDRPLGLGEKMYALSTPSLDLRVTGGHRMVYRHRWGAGARKTTGWLFDTADALAARGQGYGVPVAGVQPARGVDLTDHELALIGWFITDGNLNRRSRQLTICQAEASEFNDAIRATLDGCGMAWSVSRSTAEGQYTRRSPLLRYIVPKYKSHTRPGRGWSDLEAYLDKDLSPLLEEVTAGQLAVLLHAMHMGDGNKQRGQTWTQRSYHIGIGRKALADNLQSLCVRRGWRANVSVRPTEAGKPHYTLHAKPAPIRWIGGHGKANLAAAESTLGERVWCVQNELGTLIVRRNGKPALVGNCVGRLERDGMGAHVTAFFLVCEAGSDPVVMETLGLKRSQSEPLVDPDADPFTPVAYDESRVRRLAEAVRERRRR